MIINCMIKKFFKTTLIVIGIFLLIMIVTLIMKVINKNCNAENSLCQQGYTCNFREQKCVVAEMCPDLKPEFCIALYDPVCSEGEEYSNGCAACREGVKNYYKGKC